MIDSAEKRGEIIRRLEEALALADEVGDASTGFLIERALDEARSQQFRLPVEGRQQKAGTQKIQNKRGSWIGFG